MSTEPLDALTQFLDAIDADAPRLVVRWVDETRITPHGESGFTVAPTAHVTLTARVDGEPAQRRFDGVTLDEVKRVLRGYRLQVFYRSDNITR